MQKEVIIPYQNFSAAAGNQTMTGDDVLTSVITNILYRDTVSIQLQWTGTPTGTFDVQVSNDYSPALAQAAQVQGGGGPNSGTWYSLGAKDVLNADLAAAGSAGGQMVNLTQLGFAWIRVVYTNSDGDGVLTGIICAKSLG